MRICRTLSVTSRRKQKKTKENVLIFDIKRYAVNDGPGVRTTIFFKGCPLRCVWCHNPESWSGKPQRTYKKSKCIGCQSCVEACPQGALELTNEGIRPVEGVECLLCGRCAEECPTKALEMCGRDWSMDELLKEIEKERDIMEQSGGGVTLCGGEPLASLPSLRHSFGEINLPSSQAELQFRPAPPLVGEPPILNLLKELGKRGFHRCVDTTLYADAEVVKAVAEECELFLVDLKHMDSEKHRLYTGVGNERILENIRLLCELGAEFWIRIPLIEGVNTDEDNIKATAKFLTTLNWKTRQVNLLPYHDVGKDKHRRLWTTYNPKQYAMMTPSDETMERCKVQLEAHGFKVIIGG